MPSFGKIGLGAFVAVALLVVVDVLLTFTGSADAVTFYAAGVRLAAYAMAALAAGTAASTFGWWRESIGRPWTLFFVEFALLFINYVIRRAAPDATVALDFTLVVANLAQIVAYYLVAQSLNAAGIGFLLSPTKRVVLTIVALVAALLISESTLLEQWRAMMAGTVSGSSLIAVITDVITFTLIAPLAMSTVALRGGQVFWIFLFLTISVFGWMFNELGSAIAANLGGDANVLRDTRMAGIAVAALFNAAAATTQWMAARRAVKGMVVNA